MEAVTNFKLPWRLLAKQLAFFDEKNEIIYNHTLELIDSDELVNICLLKQETVKEPYICFIL
jgi:hypothetical protein